MNDLQPQARADKADFYSGEVALRWAHLFEPYQFANEQKAYYRTDVLVNKTDKASLEALKLALEEAKKRYKGDDTLPFTSPIKDGDKKMRSDGTPDDAYAGCWYFSAKTTKQPEVLQLTSQGIIPATPSQCGNGVKGQVVVWFFPYKFEDRKGISARLMKFLVTQPGGGCGQQPACSPAQPQQAPQQQLWAKMPTQPAAEPSPFSDNDELPF